MGVLTRMGELGNILRKYKRKVSWRIAQITVYEIIKLIPVLLLKFVVDDIISFTPAKIAGIVLYISIMLIIMILMAIGHGYFMERNNALITEIEIDVMQRSKEKMLSLGIDFHEQEAIGKKINIINDGSKDLRELLFLFLDQIIPVILQVLITTVLLFSYSWEIGLAFALFIPIIYWLNYRYAQHVKPMRKSFKQAFHDASSSLGQSITNVRTVKEFNMQQEQVSEYASHLERYGSHLMMRMKHGAKVIVQEETLMAFGRFITLALAAYLVYNGRITAGTLVMSFALSEKAYINLTRIGSFYVRCDDYLASIEELADIYLIEENIKRREKEIPIDSFKHDLAFADVSFQYPIRSSNALKRMGFALKKGEVLAVVGKSGSGKTTLIKLLMRHYDPQQGSLLLDGADIRNLNLEQYRNLFGVVSQDVELFNKSIADNIAYGSKRKSYDDIVKAAKQANAHDFIAGLPQGYQTIIGERGVKLSGGQKQRIAIARALLRKPAILVFDEATSSLDSESEQRIQDAIWKLSKDYTIIIIAHRLSTIMKADNVLVIENGKVAAFGTMKEVSRQSLIFKRMLKLQHMGELRD